MTTDSQTASSAGGHAGMLLKAAGVVTAAALLGGRSAQAKHTAFPSGSLTFEKNIPGTGDTKVLNYALALEDLEADLYKQAVQRLTTGGTNALGTTIPGLNISSNQPDVDFITEFGAVEAEHRDLLRGVLGKAAISSFKYIFGIESLSRQEVVNLVLTAEATGVGAYLGAIPFLATKTYLQIAGAIQGTEARHTAVITAILNQLFSTTAPVAPLADDNMGIDMPLTPDRVLSRVSPFIVT